MCQQKLLLLGVCVFALQCAFHVSCFNKGNCNK